MTKTRSGGRARRCWVVTAFVMSAVVIISTLHVSEAYPRERIVQRGQKECLYDRLEKDEFLTMSLFVGRGDRLEALAVMEGPVSSEGATTGDEIFADVQKYEKGSGRRRAEKDQLQITETVSYENADMEQFDDDDDDDEPHPDFDDETKMEAYFRAMEEKRAMKRQEAGMRGDDAKQQFMDGEPFERTVKINTAGWYRVCALATHNQVTVELEMRKSSELGEPSENTNWHVPTEEVSIDVMEEAEIDTEAANEEDLEQFKDYIKKLYHQLSEIKIKQEQEGRRMQVHKELNSHSHSHMVLRSLFETVLFIAVTSFQVHTIRKWFAGGPLLG